MPFGLRNVPAVFQQLVEIVLCDCRKFAAAYIDDIVIFSDTWEEHLTHLREVSEEGSETPYTLEGSF